MREITITIKLLPITITDTITFSRVCKFKLEDTSIITLLLADTGTFIHYHYWLHFILTAIFQVNLG